MGGKFWKISRRNGVVFERERTIWGFFDGPVGMMRDTIADAKRVGKMGFHVERITLLE